MAVEPLFNPTLADVKAKLRLTGAGSTDAMAILGEQVRTVRIGFYDYLGEARVAQILLTPFSENPTTATDVLRSKAAVCEIIWIRYYLLRHLPVLFQDASADEGRRYNDEQTMQPYDRGAYERELSRLLAEVDALLGSLLGSPVDTGISVSVIGPTTTQPRPGDSIFDIGGCYAGSLL